jgi:glutamate-1-semialdehyde 2,1-aminomutase
MAAGYAALSALDDAVYRHLEGLGRMLAAALAPLGTVQQVGSMISVFLGTGPVTDFESASRQDTAAFAAFFHRMLARGFYLPPSAFESWFLCAAMEERDLEALVQCTIEG